MSSEQYRGRLVGDLETVGLRWPSRVRKEGKRHRVSVGEQGQRAFASDCFVGSYGCSTWAYVKNRTETKHPVKTVSNLDSSTELVCNVLFMVFGECVVNKCGTKSTFIEFVLCHSFPRSLKVSKDQLVQKIEYFQRTPVQFELRRPGPVAWACHFPVLHPKKQAPVLFVVCSSTTTQDDNSSNRKD